MMCGTSTAIRPPPALPILAMVILLTTSCGEAAGGQDAGLPEGGASLGPPSCEYPILVGGEDGQTISVDIDTRTFRGGQLSLPECGPSTTTDPPPQAVMAYRVPGSGPHAVSITTANDGTDPTFDTALVIRRESCSRPSTEGRPACHARSSPVEIRGSASLLAEGGEVLYVILTGETNPSPGVRDRGKARVDFEAHPSHSPEIDSASAVWIADAEAELPTLRVSISGHDMDADATGVRVTAHGAALEVIDINSDGIADQDDVLYAPFDTGPPDTQSFEATAALPLSMFDVDSTIAEVWIRAVDAFGAQSEMDRAAVVQTASFVGLGEPCDAARLCVAELECSAGTCALTPERGLACDAAAVVSIPATPTMAATARVGGTFRSGRGLFAADCAGMPGPQLLTGLELLYRVTVPAGSWDIQASTDVPGTDEMVDTVLYARQVCADRTTQAVCNDDNELGLHSTIEILDAAPGDWTIFVERYGGELAPVDQDFGLSITLRPVLSSGQACDLSGIENRCATGFCTGSPARCP